MKETAESPAASGRRIQRETIAVLQDVTITFDSYLTRALSNVNLEIRRGEVFALLGPANAGKSTALRILAGRLRPTEGKVRVFGRSPRGNSARSRVGYLPGHSDQAPPQGLANLMSFLSLLVPKAGRRNRRGSDDPEEKTQRRSKLASAIRGSRELVLLDEPFADLNPSEMADIKDMLRRMSGSGQTVVLTGRNLSEIGDVCDRMALLYGGRVEAAGTLGELLAAPAAVRVLAPVLPANLSQRVLKLMREDLGKTPKHPDLLEPKAESQPATASKKGVAENAPIPAETADDVLDALVTNSAKVSPAADETSRKSGTGTMADPVDHQKLADLVKPDSGIPEGKPKN